MRRLAPLTLLVAVMLACIAPSALAQTNNGVADETPQQSAKQLQINKVDATDASKVAVNFTYNGPTADLQKLTLRENGAQVPTSQPVLLSNTGVHRALFLVIDISGSMVTSGGLEAAKTKMASLVTDKAPDDQMGLITFGYTSDVVQDLTTDSSTLLKQIQTIHGDPKAHTAMWDGIASATTLLEKVPNLQHNIILVTDGTDDASQSSAAAARGDTVSSATTVFAMGITQQHQLDSSGLSNLVRAAGGRYFVADQATKIAGAFDQVSAALGNQYVVTYPSAAKQGAASLELAVGGTSVKTTFTAGAVAAGAQNLKPQIVSGTGSGPAFLRNSTGLLVGLLLLGVAIAVAIYICVQLVVAKNSGLDAVLSHYADAPGGTLSEESSGLAQGALLQRAVALTEGFAKDRGFLEKVEDKLELADIPLRAAEVMLFYFVGVVVLVLLALVFSQNIVVGLVTLAICLMAGPALLDFRARQRQVKFARQLPDMLSLLAGALRAGFSLMQAVDAVSQEIQDPMGKELRRVLTEARLGRELEDALDDVATRTGSADFAWAVMAIRIQREVGGNLSELLMTVSETMVQRERLRRDVKSLTAEGRVSAIVLGILPPAIGVIMYVLNPEYMNPLFTNLSGQIALGLAVVMMVIGFLWMRKVIQIDV